MHLRIDEEDKLEINFTGLFSDECEIKLRYDYEECKKIFEKMKVLLDKMEK